MLPTFIHVQFERIEPWIFCRPSPQQEQQEKQQGVAILGQFLIQKSKVVIVIAIVL